MRSFAYATVVVAAGLILAGCQKGSTSLEQGPVAAPDLQVENRHIAVAPPVGDAATDRASIQRALDEAQPGSVIHFARGRYVIGLEPPSPPLVVRTRGVTLRGNSQGTVLFGGPAAELGAQQGLQLVGGEQTVEGLTFDSFFDALLIGGLPFGGLGEPNVDLSLGGYLVRDCKFKNSENGITPFLQSADVSVVRENVFLNVGSPFFSFGRTFHFVSNSISAPEPQAVPFSGRPLFGAIISALDATQQCWGNRIEDNRAAGIPDGFLIVAFEGAVCEKNVVRRNRALGQRILAGGDFGSLAGVVPFGGVLRSNLIEENQLSGSEGIGLLAFGATENVFLRNTVRNVIGSSSPDAPMFAGAGMLVDDASLRNSILQNTFGGNVGPDIVLLGDDNLVVLENRNDSVLDEGQDNRIVGGGRIGPRSGPTLSFTPFAQASRDQAATKFHPFLRQRR
jgi:hypothetical protein